MKASNQHIDPHELLAKYIAGEASAAEQLQVEHWIEADAENKRYYGHFKQVWDESLKLANNNDVDEDKAWERFRGRIHNEYVDTIKPGNNYQWLKVAAVLLLAPAIILFALSLFKHNKSEVRYATIATPVNAKDTILRSVAAGEIKTETLPDGSTITQNKNSTLSYPSTFAGRTRNVELTGEAFFNVKHNPNKPFIIKVNDVLITVLGTSFNVKGTGKTTEVIVETGIVSVTRQQQTTTLRPGEKLTATDTIESFKTETVTGKSYRSYLNEKVKKPAKDPMKTFRKDPVIILDSVKPDGTKTPDNKGGN